MVWFCTVLFVKIKKKLHTHTSPPLFLEKEQGKIYYVLPVGLTNSMVHVRGADSKKNLTFQWNPGQTWLSNVIPKKPERKPQNVQGKKTFPVS